MRAGSGVGWASLGGVAFGLVACLLLTVMRVSSPGWPLHPVGYAISGSWQINVIWLSMLIAWIAKALILRYGGLRGLRQAIPFFFGLILGEFVIGSLSTVVSVAADVPLYRIWEYW